MFGARFGMTRRLTPAGIGVKHSYATRGLTAFCL